MMSIGVSSWDGLPESAERDYGMTPNAQRLANALLRATAAAAGIIVATSPPNEAISLTRLELT